MRLLRRIVAFVVLGMALDAMVLARLVDTRGQSGSVEQKAVGLVLLVLLGVLVWATGQMLLNRGMEVVSLMILRESGGVQHVALYDVQSSSKLVYFDRAYRNVYDNAANYQLGGRVHRYESKGRWGPLVEPAYVVVHPEYPALVFGSDVYPAVALGLDAFLSSSTTRILWSLLGIEAVLVGLSCLWKFFLGAFELPRVLLVVLPLVIPWLGLVVLCMTRGGGGGPLYETLRGALLGEQPSNDSDYEAVVDWNEAHRQPTG